MKPNDHKMHYQVNLLPEERNALLEEAKFNMRDLREQMRWILVTHLMQFGYLPTDYLEVHPLGGDEEKG